MQVETGLCVDTTPPVFAHVSAASGQEIALSSVDVASCRDLQPWGSRGLSTQLRLQGTCVSVRVAPSPVPLRT